MSEYNTMKESLRINKHALGNSEVNLEIAEEEINVLKSRVSYQELLLEKQEKQIRRLESTIKTVQYEVYKILSGIYNQRSQEDVAQYHVDTIYESSPSRLDEDDDNILPTTRQGDGHESRITALEEFVEMTATAAAKTIAKPKESHAFTRDFCGNN